MGDGLRSSLVSRPLASSQMRTMQSPDAVARCNPSGRKRTAASCPRSPVANRYTSESSPTCFAQARLAMTAARIADRARIIETPK